MAFLFDEVNDYVLFDGSDSSLGLGSAWSFAGWVKLTDNTGTGVQYILSHSVPDANPSISWRIGEASNGTASVRNQLLFNLGDNDTTDTGDVVSTSQPFLSNTSWTHVALIKSGSSIIQYIAGAADVATTDSAFGSVTITELYMGSRSDLSATSFLGGSLAEWAKWDRALSTAEISSLADGFSPLFFQDSLVWYAPMVRSYQEIITGLLTVTNSGSTVTAHPPMRYPGRGVSGRPVVDMSQTISISGITSVTVLGTPDVQLNITTTGVTSVSALGTPSVTIDNTITLTGLATTTATGTVVVTREGTIDLSGLSSITAIGTATVNNTQIITLTGLSETTALGSPSVSTIQTISFDGLSSQSSIGTLSVNNVQVIELSGIESVVTFGTPILADLGFRLVTPTTGDFSYVPF